MLTTVHHPASVVSSSLLIVLHGLGDSTEGWSWLPEALRLPWLNYLLVNAPDDYYGGYSWYDLPGDSGPGIERSRKELSALLDSLVAGGIPASQIGLLGFSQGCLMTLETGFRYPAPLAGLVGISGYVWNPTALLREAPPAARLQRALVTHGRRDTVVPCGPVRGQIEELKAGGLSVEWHEFDKAHTVAGEPEMALIRDFLVRGFRRETSGKA
jgi:phospholipase/carboxylesterase